MRTSILCCAIAVGVASTTPAHADLYTLTGAVSGTESQVVCNPYDPSCFVSSPFSFNFGLVIDATVGPGNNPFSWGSPYSTAGEYGGTIVDTNGVLSGIDLSYGKQTCGPGIPPIGCKIYSGGADTFTVQQGAVPEPATWAMILLGFGAMGLALRRRPREADCSRAAQSQFGSETLGHQLSGIHDSKRI